MDKIIKPIVLPKDNGPHENSVEWWYFNGHLVDGIGNEYSFMNCLFKVDYQKVQIPHISGSIIPEYFKYGDYIFFAHSVVSDINNQKNYKDIQNISLISKDSFPDDLLFINYTDPDILAENTTSEIIETDPNNFHIKNKNLCLNLISKKSPLLEGGHGYVGTPSAGTYYYSLTDLEVSGMIYVEGKEIEVTGRGWMDHQWADAVYKRDKWTWFSFQLDDGTDLMCVEYDTKIGSDILINVIDKNGLQLQYNKASFTAGKNVWSSKKTKAKYPLTWMIDIPDGNIIIKTDSLLKDQEMIFGQINYWEGPMAVTATINGKEIKGKGFMELVGYPSNYNYLLVAGEEIESNIFKKISSVFFKRRMI